MPACPKDPERTVAVGALSGLATCIVYPALTVAQPPEAVALVLAASMGPLLAVASWGLRKFLDLHRPSLSADLGAMFNALAGALLTAMFLVQFAIGVRTGDHPTREAEAVWLGLDVAWDVYIGLGTLLFAINALYHPRLGRITGSLGVLIALGLLGFNLATFPTPPANAGLIDLGPFIGAWYLLVTVLVIRSRRWVRQRAGAHVDASE